jgi:Putative Flp pilus-assembly TadE/G-like
MKRKVWALIRESRAVSGVMTAMIIAIFVAVMALVIDLGHLHGVRNELQNAADAAALAGARALIKIDDYPVVEAPDPPYCGTAFEKAREAILANRSDGGSLQMDLGATLDVTLGWWDWGTGTPTFTPYFYQYPGPDPVSGNCSLDKINAVNVVVRRSDTGDSAGPSVFTTFAKLFGWDSAPVVASSTAAIGYMFQNCTAAPIALCEDYYFNELLGSDTPRRATFRTSNPDQSDPSSDEAFFVAPCKVATPNARTLRDWIADPSSIGCYDACCMDPTEGSLEVVLKDVIGGIKWKLNQIRNTQEWSHQCVENGPIYEGWLLTVPILDNCKGTGKHCCPDISGCDGDIVDWKPVLIQRVWEPNDLSQLKKDDPTNPVLTDCTDSNKACLEIFQIPCGVQVQGDPGPPTNQILATRPKLVQFDKFYSQPSEP